MKLQLIKRLDCQIGELLTLVSLLESAGVNCKRLETEVWDLTTEKHQITNDLIKQVGKLKPQDLCRALRIDADDMIVHQFEICRVKGELYFWYMAYLNKENQIYLEAYLERKCHG